jgi:hypothetical protein
MAGHFEEALELCRRGLEDASEVAPDAVELLEAELICVASVQADRTAEARERLAHPAVPATTELWRPNAAAYAMFGGEPAADALAILRPLLESGGLAGEPDSLLNTVATLVLIQGDELEVACASCTALIELARPRGWLIALHHGSFLRAIALVCAGRVREAEADARLSFEFKLRHSALHALLWSLYPLVDALTESDQPESADAALAAAGLGDPPEGALTAPLLLRAARGCGSPSTAPRRRLRTCWTRASAGRRSGTPTRGSPRGTPTRPRRSSRSVSPPRRAGTPRRTSSSRSGSDCPGRSARGCGRSHAPRIAASGSRCSNAPPACSPAPAPSSSTPGRSSTSGQRCAGPTAAPTHASRCAARSTSPSATACGCWPAARATSCTWRAPARAAPHSRGRTR